MAFKALVDNNKVDILSSFGGYFELDDLFVSKQTFGFWAKIIDEAKIHNDIVNLDKLDFKKYSKFNRKNKLLNYQKVKILYDLAVKIRNRAFHFENLYKLNDYQTPRISTRVGKALVAIDPQMLGGFVNEMFFDKKQARYINNWRTNSALNFVKVRLNNIFT